jgi:hypothetical protein
VADGPVADDAGRVDSVVDGAAPFVELVLAVVPLVVAVGVVVSLGFSAPQLDVAMSTSNSRRYLVVDR